MKPSVILASGQRLSPDNATMFPNGCLGLEVGGTTVALLSPTGWSRVVLDPLAFAKMAGDATTPGVVDLQA